MSDELIARIEGAAGRISLNRPRALNALTHAMCADISATLQQWRAAESVQAIILDHAEGRGFCAGGDVAAVRRSVLEDGGSAGRAFFRAEYRMNHLLFTFPVPIVAFMDGVTMGGGAGLALPARYRVATENTLFAMPEGAIGLFPDVGAGWYLPRLPGRIGVFLALTGARLDGAECLWAGIATHYLPAENLAEAKTRIAEHPGEIGAILDSLSIEPPPARLAGNAERIDRLFGPDTLEGILSALAADDSKWAGKEWQAVATKCPTSAKVALRLLAENAGQADFAREMAREYRIATRMIARADFAEGVRAVLVDKDNTPRWNPARPEDVSDAMIDAIFASLHERQGHDRQGHDGEWSPFPATAP